MFIAKKIICYFFASDSYFAKIWTQSKSPICISQPRLKQVNEFICSLYKPKSYNFWVISTCFTYFIPKPVIIDCNCLKYQFRHSFGWRENRLFFHLWHWKVSSVILTAKIGSQKHFLPFPLDSLECFFSITNACNPLDLQNSTILNKIDQIPRLWGECTATYDVIFMWKEVLLQPNPILWPLPPKAILIFLSSEFTIFMSAWKYQEYNLFSRKSLI